MCQNFKENSDSKGLMKTFRLLCSVDAHNAYEAVTASLIKENRNVTKPNLLCAVYDSCVLHAHLILFSSNWFC